MITQRWVLFLIATCALAQQPAVFRSTTQLIQIDVAAEGKNGFPVADLTKDDFELRVNGKPHAIDTFTAISSAPVVTEPLPRGTFSNRRQVSEVKQGRYTAFVLDCRNTNFTLQSFAIQQLQKMLAMPPPGGKLALYVIDNGFHIVQEFTSDPELLKDRAASMTAVMPPPVTDLAQAEAAAKETVSAFRSLAKHLGGISGQKIVIWLSTGFPDNEPAPPAQPDTAIVLTSVREAPSTSFLADIDDAVSVLGNANIVLESIEASYAGASVSPENGPVTTYVNPLQMIAERTGGRFFPAESSDLGATIRKAATDRMGGYELGFYDEGDWISGWIPVDFRIKRPGVTLRYRQGFYPAPAAPQPTAQDLLERAVDAFTIPITAKVTRTAGNRGTLRLNLNVDAKALTLRQDGAVWRTKPSFFTRFASDVEEQVGDVPLDSPELTLTQAQHDRALRDGINLRFTVRAKEGAVALRVLVRDESSGAAGTVTIPLSSIPEAY
jgi:VWFA-related protein